MHVASCCKTFPNSRESASGSGAAIASATGSAAHHPPWSPDDPEYYNDLPGKVPPDIGPPPVPPLPNYQSPAGGGPGSASSGGGTSGLKKVGGPTATRHGLAAVDLSDNLIDLNADVSSPASANRMDGASGGGAAAGLQPFPDHEYVNGIVGSGGDFAKVAPGNKDPFDMRKKEADALSPFRPSF